MPRHRIKSRARFFVAVEGESEQSFVKWLQRLADGTLHIHLDTVVLGGGGYKTMLQEAVRQHKRRCGLAGGYRDRFLMVDQDRAEKGDWELAKLRREAARLHFSICAQVPNHEGLLLRMIPGFHHHKPAAASATTELKIQWPAYQKPADAWALGRRFTLDDLLRAADNDTGLAFFLNAIGLMSGRRNASWNRSRVSAKLKPTE